MGIPLPEENPIAKRRPDDECPSAVTSPDRVSSNIVEAVSARAGLTTLGALAWMLGLIEPE